MPDRISSNLPLANTRWERFALSVAAGAALGAAYRSAGYSSSWKSAQEAASRLSRNVKISDRIEFLTDQNRRAQQGSRDWLLYQLIRNVRICMGEEPVIFGDVAERPHSAPIYARLRDAHAANRALELLARSLGCLEERS